MKTILKILGGLLLLILLAVLGVYFFGTSDLRTETVKNNFDAERGQALLSAMAEAHGVPHWDSMETYSVQFEDKFFGKIPGEHAFQSDEVKMTIDYIPKTYNGRLTFEEGMPKGTVWGIQSWKTYIQPPNESIEWKQDGEVYFWLPTYQYFVEFPARILKADVVSYAGEREIEGRTCEGIYATWKMAEPQRDIDQYLIWVDKETKLITLMEYTIREKMNFLVGGAYFKEIQDFDGLKLPTFLPVISGLVDGYLHEMRITGIQRDKVSKSDILPNENLEFIGDDKPVE